MCVCGGGGFLLSSLHSTYKTMPRKFCSPEAQTSVFFTPHFVARSLKIFHTLLGAVAHGLDLTHFLYVIIIIIVIASIAQMVVCFLNQVF